MRRNGGGLTRFHVGPEGPEAAADRDGPEPHRAETSKLTMLKPERRLNRLSRVVPKAVEIETLHVAGPRVRLETVAVPLQADRGVRAPVCAEGHHAFERREPSRVPQLPRVVAQTRTEPAARSHRRDDGMHGLLKNMEDFSGEGDQTVPGRSGILSCGPSLEHQERQHGGDRRPHQLPQYSRAFSDTRRMYSTAFCSVLTSASDANRGWWP